MTKKMYRPLPDCVGVAPSSIHGTGLVALKDIKSDYEFGVTHIKDHRFDNGYIRTPLGGFFNHSDDPNCKAYTIDDLIFLKSLRPIRIGEEITAKYWLYEVAEND